MSRSSELVESYWKLGWQPTTLAATNRDGVLVERYGDALEEGIVFAVQNNSGSKNYFDLKVSAAVLGIPSDGYEVTDLASGKPVPSVRSNGTLVIHGDLPGHQKALYAIRGTA